MSKKVKWVRQRQQCQCFTLKGEDFKARKKPFAIPWLITFSLVRNDSFLTGTLQLCLSKTFKEAVLRRQKWRTNWPFDCTQRPFEWGERRRKWSSGAGRGPWFLGRWTSPRDISVHTHPHTQCEYTITHAAVETYWNAQTLSKGEDKINATIESLKQLYSTWLHDMKGRWQKETYRNILMNNSA